MRTCRKTRQVLTRAHPCRAVICCANEAPRTCTRHHRKLSSDFRHLVHCPRLPSLVHEVTYRNPFAARGPITTQSAASQTRTYAQTRPPPGVMSYSIARALVSGNKRSQSHPREARSWERIELWTFLKFVIPTPLVLTVRYTSVWASGRTQMTDPD